MSSRGRIYARTFVGKLTIYLQRFITDCPPGFRADHWDRDTLNNRRPNLRIATVSQNNANREGFGISGFRGVSRDNRQRKWRARIKLDDIEKTLGYFDTKIEAAKAYDAANHARFGEFAYLNFPEDYPRPPDDFDDPPF